MHVGRIDEIAPEATPEDVFSAADPRRYAHERRRRTTDPDTGSDAGV